MSYYTFCMYLDNLKLSKQDFAVKTGMNYKSVTNWCQVKQVPAWVDSWLLYYASHLKLLQIKETLADVL